MDPAANVISLLGSDIVDTAVKITLFGDARRGFPKIVDNLASPLLGLAKQNCLNQGIAC